METLLTTKICAKCKESKNLDEFNKNKNSKDGRQAYCRSCARAIKAKHYQDNRESEIEKAKRWNKDNADRCRENEKRWRDENREHYSNTRKTRYQKNRIDILEKQKQYRQENLQYCRDREQQWRDANRDSIRERKRRDYYADPDINKKRYQRNPDYEKQRSARRRALKRDATIGVVTPEALEARIAYYGGMCWICRERPYEHLDHVKPLSKGGAHMLANLRPACAECNLSKSNKWPFVPPERRRNV